MKYSILLIAGSCLLFLSGCVLFEKGSGDAWARAFDEAARDYGAYQ